MYQRHFSVLWAAKILPYTNKLVFFLHLYMKWSNASVDCVEENQKQKNHMRLSKNKKFWLLSELFHEQSGNWSNGQFIVYFRGQVPNSSVHKSWLGKKNTVLNVPFVQLDTQTDSSDKTFYDKIFQPVSILAEMLPEFYQENRLFNSNAECLLCFCAVDW